LLVLACGITPFLGSLGIFPMRLTPGTPVWVGVSAGMLFVIAGAMSINGAISFRMGCGSWSAQYSRWVH
jgi:hypothetical protein